MHFGRFLNDVQRVIESVFRRAACQRGQCPFGTDDVLRVHRITQRVFGRRILVGRIGRDRVQDFARPAAMLANALRVSVQHFEHRQRLPLGWQGGRHVIGRRGGAIELIQKPQVLLADRCRIDCWVLALRIGV